MRALVKTASVANVRSRMARPVIPDLLRRGERVAAMEATEEQTMTDILIGSQWHEWHTCPDCGVIYTCPKHMIEGQRQTGNGAHYCPNGHRLSYHTSENEKLRRERDRLKQEQARLEQEVADALREAEQERRKTARLKKRASAGNCPCCKRTFANMATHMKRQHPEFVKEHGANVVPLKAVPG